MAYTQTSDFTPSGGPIAASATPGAVAASGWIDLSGSIWSVDASNKLITALGVGGPWNAAVLARSGDTPRLNSRIRCAFKFLSSPAVSLYGMPRLTRSGGNSSGYLAGVGRSGTANITIGRVVSGSYAQIGSTQALSLVDGTDYVLEMSVEQTNSTTSSIIVTVYAADGTTVIGTRTVTDTTSGLQNVAGYPGIFQYLATTGTPLPIANIQTLQNDSVLAATAISLSGPTTGGVGQASSAFTVAANGLLSSNVVVTPSDGGAGGTFTPATVTLTPGTTSGSFTYTPTSSGAKTISVANNGGLTNPSPATYTASNLSTVPVTSAAFKFSPGNWKGDAGRGGSLYRRTWNNGAWFDFVWTAGAAGTTIILLPTTTTTSKISYVLNGVLTENVAATGNVTITGVVASSVNKLRVWIRNSAQTARWNDAVNKVEIQGVQIDGTAGTAPSANPWGAMYGDSLTEAIQADDGGDNFLRGYAFLVATALDAQGFDVGISACGYSGWLRPGDSGADVPAFYAVSGSSGGEGGTYDDASTRWNKIDAGVSILDINGHYSAYGSTGTEPAFLYVNYMTNEALAVSNVSDAQASVKQWLIAARAAAPDAVIIVQMPFGLRYSGKYTQSYKTALINGVAAYQTANPTDGKVILLDFGDDFAKLLQANGSTYLNADRVHYNRAGGALAAPLVAQGILLAMNAARPKVSNVQNTDLVTIIRAGKETQVSAAALKAYLAA